MAYYISEIKVADTIYTIKDVAAHNILVNVPKLSGGKLNKSVLPSLSIDDINGLRDTLNQKIDEDVFQTTIDREVSIAVAADINSRNLATEAYVTGLLTDYATTASLKDYVLVATLADYATVKSLDNYAKVATLDDYVLNTTLANYATVSYVEKLFDDFEPGTMDYNNLSNKPIINGVTVQGTLSLADLGITGSGGSGEGTTNYEELSNRPAIDGIELTKNSTAADLGLLTAETDPIYTKERASLATISYVEQNYATPAAITEATKNLATTAYVNSVITQAGVSKRPRAAISQDNVITGADGSYYIDINISSYPTACICAATIDISETEDILLEEYIPLFSDNGISRITRTESSDAILIRAYLGSAFIAARGTDAWTGYLYLNHFLDVSSSADLVLVVDNTLTLVDMDNSSYPMVDSSDASVVVQDETAVTYMYTADTSALTITTS